MSTGCPPTRLEHDLLRVQGLGTFPLPEHTVLFLKLHWGYKQLVSAPSPSPLSLTRPTQVSSFCVHVIDFLKNLDVRLRVVNSMGLALARCSAHQSSHIAIMSPSGVALLPPSLVAGVHLSSLSSSRTSRDMPPRTGPRMTPLALETYRKGSVTLRHENTWGTEWKPKQR